MDLENFKSNMTSKLAMKVRETMVGQPVATLDGGAYQRDHCLSLSEYADMKK